VGDVLEHVEPGHALRDQELRGIRLVLLQRRRQNVARLDFLAPGALHVQDRGLQHAAERERLLRLFLLAPAELLDRLLQVFVEVFPQLRQVGAARRQDALAVRVVRQGIEQMLEREVSVPPGGSLTIRNGQDDLEGGTEHVSRTVFRLVPWL
jgi:hypothetical protein